MQSLPDLWFRDLGGPLSPEQITQREEEMRAAYGSGYGKRALILALGNLCFFREAMTDEDIALNNMAKRMLGEMGIWLPGNEEKIIDALLSVTRP